MLLGAVFNNEFSRTNLYPLNIKSTFKHFRYHIMIAANTVEQIIAATNRFKRRRIEETGNIKMYADVL